MAMRHEPKLGEFGFAGDDHVVPFEVGPLDVRGRTVQLGPMLDQILERHDYPEPVARLLAEVCVLTVLLGTALKFDGKFILQTRSDGPVDMLVADFTTPRSLRAYARFDAERLADAIASGNDRPEQLLGERRAGAHHRPGRVHAALPGHRPARRRLAGGCRARLFPAVRADPDRCQALRRQAADARRRRGQGALAGRRHPGAVPAGGARAAAPARPAGRRRRRRAGNDNDPTDNSWQELLALLATVEPAELVDPSVGAERLLYRLFHEHGVRVFEGVKVADECSCSRDKVRGILGGFSAEEIKDSIEDGAIKVSCEFCSKAYEFDPAEFRGTSRNRE